MATPKKPVVLLTGAGGRIGAGFREEYLRHYADFYDLRLAPHHPEKLDDDRFADVVALDIEDLASARTACKGVDTIIHLAANPDWQADFCDGLVGQNIVGAYHMFEAARLEGCRRMVYASSVHAIMGYPVDVQAHHHDPPRPDTLYGVTKVFGEGLCSSYSYCHGLSCIAVRIGAYVAEADMPKLSGSDNPQQLDIVVSQRDLAQLLHKCVTAPDDVRYAIVNGLSHNRFKRMDIEGARELLGYEPQDDAFKWTQAVHLGAEKKV